jgi:hairy-and-enhancer-of-split protein
VRHLHKLRRQHSLGLTPEAAYADRFRAGFTHCAAEVVQYLAAASAAGCAPNIDPTARSKLLQHLGSCMDQIDCTPSNPLQTAADPNHATPKCYNNAYTPPASPHLQVPVSPSATQVLTSAITKPPSSPVWRPW